METSQSLRTKIVALHEEGYSPSQTARQIGVTYPIVRLWIRPDVCAENTQELYNSLTVLKYTAFLCFHTTIRQLTHQLFSKKIININIPSYIWHPFLATRATNTSQLLPAAISECIVHLPNRLTHFFKDNFGSYCTSGPRVSCLFH